MAQSEKMLLASAAALLDSSRNMEHVVSVLETMSAEQSALLERLTDKIDSMGKKQSVGSQIKDLGKGGKEVAGALKDFADVIPVLSKNLMRFAAVPQKVKDGFISFVEGLSKAMMMTGGKKKDSKEAKSDYANYGQAFKTISEGIADFSIGLFLFALTPKIVRGDKDKEGSFLNFLNNLNEHFKKTDPKKTAAAADSIKSMASSIFLFGLSLAASTLFYAIGAVGSIIIIPLIAGYAYLFNQLGDKTIVKKIDAGAKALAWMGLGLVSFALGLFAVKELAGGDWGEFAKGSLIVILGATVFSFLFYELGEKEHAERVETGAKAMVFVGVALASLALGIWAFQVLNVGLVPVLMAGLAVAVVGLAFGIAGEFSKQIEEGAASLFFSGIALASLALGLWVFQKMDIGIGTVLMAGLAVGVLGLLFGIAGMVAGEIALGALAFLGVALAIIAIGFGFEMFKKNKVELADIGMVSGALIALGVIMAGAGVISWLIIPGAIALITSGLALISISKGLEYFKKVDFDDSDADKMKYVISSLAASFSLAGGKEGMSSFLGISIGKNNVERGIDSVLNAGAALMSIAKGLTAFRGLKLGKDEAVDLWGDGTLENPGSIGLVIAGISAQFGAIGAKASVKSTGLLGLLGYQRNDVETGISAVMKTGDALTSVAKGLKAFMKDAAGIDVQAFADSLSIVINGISAAFSVVGGASNSRGTSGLLGLIGVERNSVEVGINAVKDVGKTLVDLAAGVKAFANLTFTDPRTGKEVAFTKADLTNVSLNIMSVLTSVSSAFAVIGTGKTQDAFGGLFGAGDVPVKKGIDAVKGIGKELADLAQGVKLFANLTFKDPITGKEVIFGKPDLARVSTNIMSVLTAVSSAFGLIGSAGEVSAGGITGLFGAKENVVAKGVEAVKGIGTELNKIATSVKIFADIKDIDKIKSNIMSIITSVPAAFLTAYTSYIKFLPDAAMSQIKSFNGILGKFIDVIKEVPADADKKGMSLGTSFDKIAMGLSGLGNLKNDSIEKAVSFMERLAKTSDPLIKLADSFERIAKSMDKFSEVFKKMNPQNVKTSDLLIQSLVTFAKVDPNALNTLTDKGKALISFIYEKGAEKASKETPATQPEASNAVQSEPGKKPVPSAYAPPVVEKTKEPDNTAMTQMMTDLTTNMAGMASALKDIKMILTGNLRVVNVTG